VDSELEVIHHQMEEKRASLAEKLDVLENQVLGTVQDATATVANTVEDVKSAVDNVTDSVQDAVQSVKETFDISEHVRRNPWAALGTAFAVGFAGAWLLGPSSGSKSSSTSFGSLGMGPTPTPPPTPTPSPVASSNGHGSSSESAGEGTWTHILETVQGMAVGALMHVVGEVATQSVPDSMRSDVSNLLDEITTSLGGKPIPRSSGSGTSSFSSGSEGIQKSPTSPTPASASMTGAMSQASETPSTGHGERRRAGRKGSSDRFS